MGLTRLNLVGIGLAVGGLILVAIGLWPWAWPLIIASLACSFISEKRRRQSQRVIEVAPEPGWLLDSREEDGTRVFEPFCDCPKCGHPNYHLFGAPRERVESGMQWIAGSRHLWMEDEEDIQFRVWNKPGVYKIHRRETGQMVPAETVTTVVDRECLSCRHEWTEKVS